MLAIGAFECFTSQAQRTKPKPYRATWAFLAEVATSLVACGPVSRAIEKKASGKRLADV